MKPTKKRTKRKGGWKRGVGGGDRPILIDKDEHAHVVEEVAPHEFETFPIPDAPAAAAPIRSTPATRRRKRR